MPQDGTYDLSVFANSLNTFDGGRRSRARRTCSCASTAAPSRSCSCRSATSGWSGTTPTPRSTLTAGTHTITPRREEPRRHRRTKGDAIIDKIDLSLRQPRPRAPIYEAEYADLQRRPAGLRPRRAHPARARSRSTRATPRRSGCTRPTTREATLDVQTLGGGTASLAVNGVRRRRMVAATTQVPVFLSGGVNKVTCTGGFRRPRSSTGSASARPTARSRRSATRRRTPCSPAPPQVSPLSLAIGRHGGHRRRRRARQRQHPDVRRRRGREGRHVRADASATPTRSSRRPPTTTPTRSPATPTSPINGEPTRVWFPHTFHQNNFWELTVPVELDGGIEHHRDLARGAAELRRRAPTSRRRSPTCCSARSSRRTWTGSP